MAEQRVRTTGAIRYGVVLTVIYVLLLPLVFFVHKKPATDIRIMEGANELGELVTGLVAPLILLWLIIGVYIHARSIDANR